MRTVLLIRHGHVDGLAPERFRGRWDLPLTPLGQRQALVVAEYVRQRWPQTQAVFASPLARCRDTATAIAMALGLRMETVAGLVDLDYGICQGLTRDEAAAHWPSLVARWFVKPHRVQFPGGESLFAMAARAGQTLTSCLNTAPPDGTIALVAHDSVNRALLCQILGMTLSNYWRLRQDPCCVNVIEAGVTFRLALMNATDHLAGMTDQAPAE